MSQNTTLHVKLDSKMAEDLTELARRRQVSKGQLVREALLACYQPDLKGLSQKQKQAVHAYRGGFIGLGKLAAILGMHPLELRTWLDEHGVQQNTQFHEQDRSNA